MKFETNYNKIISQLENVDPIRYSKSRNYIDGDVTYLSPYISRGVISTKFVLNKMVNKGYDPSKIEKFIQELAWRDFWQLVWVNKGKLIDQDLKSKQTEVENHSIPNSIVNASTTIDAIDQSIRNLYETGYMHNHVRMYVASLACNIAKSHWSLPAKWMYYHLFDADWASNALSWQWVAGSNSKKKYLTNQKNINKFCYTNQTETFLDLSYEDLPKIDIPDELSDLIDLKLTTSLPEKNDIVIDPELPTLIYNFYNLDPNWKSGLKANRILLLEPSIFNDYPISDKTLEFVLELSKNINSIQVFAGEFNELAAYSNNLDIYFKEHPLNKHYTGTEESRDWMFAVKGDYSSFFSFWNKCKKELK